MSVYFALRSPYVKNHRKIIEFKTNSILSWFNLYWEQLIDNPEELVGDVYGFDFEDIDENDNKVEAPRTFEELDKLLHDNVYHNELVCEPDCIQCITDDDEVALAWYIFDDNYKKAHYDILAIWFENLASPNKPNNELEYPELKTRTTISFPESQSNDKLYLNLMPESSSTDAIITCQLKNIGFKNLFSKVILHNFNYYPKTPYPETMVIMFLDLLKTIKNQNPNLSDSELWQHVTEYDWNDEKHSRLSKPPKNFALNHQENLVELATFDPAFLNSYSNERIAHFYAIIFDETFVKSNPILANSINHFFNSWYLSA